MVRIVGVERPDHAEVVNAAGDVWEKLGDLDAALAVRSCREWRGHEHPAIGSLRAGRNCRRPLAGVFREHRLGVECVEVRRPAIHEQEDDSLRSSGKVWRPGGQWSGRRVRLRTFGPVRERRDVSCLSQDTRQPQRTETAAHPAQPVTSGKHTAKQGRLRYRALVCHVRQVSKPQAPRHSLSVSQSTYTNSFAARRAWA